MLLLSSRPEKQKRRPAKREKCTIKSVIAAALFVVLTVLVGMGVLKQGDLSLFGALPSWDVLHLFLIPFGAAVSALWLAALLFFLAKQNGRKDAGLFLLVFALASIVEILLKILLHQPAGDMPHSALGIVLLENTYPSGHVLRATLLSGGLLSLGTGRWVWVFPAIEALAMFSLQGHWASDLLGGFLLGLAALALYSRFRGKDS